MQEVANRVLKMSCPCQYIVSSSRCMAARSNTAIRQGWAHWSEAACPALQMSESCGAPGADAASPFPRHGGSISCHVLDRQNGHPVGLLRVIHGYKTLRKGQKFLPCMYCKRSLKIAISSLAPSGYLHFSHSYSDVKGEFVAKSCFARCLHESRSTNQEVYILAYIETATPHASF